MYLVMFDIDGTLIDSSGFEDENYLTALRKILNKPIESNWLKYNHVSDSGILDQIIEENGLSDERNDIYLDVQQYFFELQKNYLSKKPAIQISGAGDFIKLLAQRDDVELAIATGGWELSAKLKLESCGIDFSGISFASSSDHFSRTEIMKIAEKKCLNKKFTNRTYFGDAEWDKQASQELGYNFILVGDAISNPKQIMDFNNSAKALALIGLEPK